MDNKNRKSNLFIERVNDHRDTYRLKLSDGTPLELNKVEIGNFIPQKGMSIQMILFNNLILQEVQLDGISILYRTPMQLLSTLDKLKQQLEATNVGFQEILSIEQSDDYAKLPLAFYHRLQMLKLLLKNQFTAKILKKELMICQLATLLSNQTNIFISMFERKSAQNYQQFSVALQMEAMEIIDAKYLAHALRKDWKLKFNTVRDFENSEVLNYNGVITPLSLRPLEAIRRYVIKTMA